MAVNGNINVNVSFLDKDEQSNVDTEKTITLSSSEIYTAGKVAIVTGTCGTALGDSTFHFFSPTNYRNASGDFVAISSPRRVAFAASGSNVVELRTDGGSGIVRSSNDEAAVTTWRSSLGESFFSATVIATSGTSAYTVVLYGE